MTWSQVAAVLLTCGALLFLAGSLIHLMLAFKP